jgi:uncharacterized membrane protein
VRSIGTNRILSAGFVTLVAAYPLAVYFLLRHGSIRMAGLGLLAVVVIRFLMPGAMQIQVLAALATGAVFAAGIALTSSEALARLYPVGVSAVLLAAFAFTLIRPPSMIERLARATGASLNAAAILYTRAWTVIWCAFFLVNGCIALGTALLGSREAWAIYNGFLSYVIAGTLFLGEQLIRPLVRRRLAETESR